MYTKIELITENEQKDENNIMRTIELDRKTIDAKKLSVTQKEYYLAMQAGIKLEITFVIRASSYKGESTVVYNYKNYKVERTNQQNEAFITLICSQR
jgi:hypothetical protein